MTLPPNRIGGARGPGGVTLTEIRNQLDAMMTTQNETFQLLLEMSNGITSIATALQPDGVTHGQLATIANAASNSYEQLLLLTEGFHQFAVIEGADAGYFGAAFYLQNIYNRLETLRSQLTDPLQQQLQAQITIRQHTSTLVTALGTLDQLPQNTTIKALLVKLNGIMGELTGVPVGSTIKDLLRSIDLNVSAIEACACEGSGGAQPLNPSPANACSGYNYGPIRNQDYFNAQTPIDMGGEGNSYQVWFGYLGAQTGEMVFADADTAQGLDVVAYYSPSNALEYKLSWDFSGNTLPTGATLRRFGTSDFYSEIGAGTTLNPFEMPTGTYTFTVDAGVRWMFVIDLPSAAAVPNNNFHLCVRQAPS